MTAGYRPGSSRPGSSGVHTKVEEDLHTMAGIDYDKVSIHSQLDSAYSTVV